MKHSALVFFLVCFPWLTTTGQAQEQLTLANTPTFLTGLVTIAQDQKFYAAEDLAITIHDHPTGDEALFAVEKGEADIATVAETAFVLHRFEQPDLRVLGLIGSWDNEVRILARRDKGIDKPEDLRGKRIGTQQRLSTYFFLDQFLLKYGLTIHEIIPVFAKAPQLAEALLTGGVDAISMRDPFISRAREQLGENGVLFEAPGLYDKVFLLAMRRQNLVAKDEAISRLLKALLRAEHFIRQHPEQAREILRRAQPEAGTELDRAWLNLRLRVWLDHRFVLTLEHVADWALRNHLVPDQPIPDFLPNLHPQPLRQLRPIAINLLN
ncbi:MAG: ABC transporter substrate-binding protein [Magnetococcus sp. YQC-9]